MCDQDQRLLAGQGAYGSGNIQFVLRVGGGRGLVQNQDRAVLEQSPGDGNALLLAAAEVHAFLTDLRVVTVVERLDEVVRLRQLRGLDYFSVRGLRAAKLDVFRHAGRLDERILEDEGHQ